MYSAGALGFISLRSLSSSTTKIPPVAVLENALQQVAMTAGAPFPAEAAPYAWDASHSPIAEAVMRLWEEVANGIDKSQTGTCMHPN